MNDSTREGMGSSGAGDAATPRDFFTSLDNEFAFNLDLAAAPGLTMVPECYFGEAGYYEADGLAVPHADGAFGFGWTVHPGDPARREPVRGWLNPPYGPGLGKWISRASDESRCGATIVALLPARKDLPWWQREIEPYRRVEVRNVAGRIAFGGWGPKGKPIPRGMGAFFPSTVVVFRPPRVAFPVGDPEKFERERERKRVRDERDEAAEARRIARIDRRLGVVARKENAEIAKDRKATEKVRLASVARLADLVSIATALSHVPTPRLRDVPDVQARIGLAMAKKISRRYLPRRKMDPEPAPAAGTSPAEGPAEKKEA